MVSVCVRCHRIASNKPNPTTISSARYAKNCFPENGKASMRELDVMYLPLQDICSIEACTYDVTTAIWCHFVLKIMRNDCKASHRADDDEKASPRRNEFKTPNCSEIRLRVLWAVCGVTTAMTSNANQIHVNDFNWWKGPMFAKLHIYYTLLP